MSRLRRLFHFIHDFESDGGPRDPKTGEIKNFIESGPCINRDVCRLCGLVTETRGRVVLG